MKTSIRLLFSMEMQIICVGIAICYAALYPTSRSGEPLERNDQELSHRDGIVKIYSSAYADQHNMEKPY